MSTLSSTQMPAYYAEALDVQLLIPSKLTLRTVSEVRLTAPASFFKKRSRLREASRTQTASVSQRSRLSKRTQRPPHLSAIALGPSTGAPPEASLPHPSEESFGRPEAAGRGALRTPTAGRRPLVQRPRLPRLLGRPKRLTFG